MDENQVKKIVQDEIEKAAKKAQYGVTRVPVHTHNNIDSLNIPAKSVNGFATLPGPPGGVVALATGQTMSGPPTNGSTLAPPQVVVYPIPIIYGPGVGPGGIFSEGEAPDGTVLFFDSLSADRGLWVKTENGWVQFGTGGGGGTPGGADTNVQFNDAGSFGGTSDFTWDKTNFNLDFVSGVSIRTQDDATLNLSVEMVGSNISGGDINLNPGIGDGAGFKAGDVIVETHEGFNGSTKGRFVLEGDGTFSYRVVGLESTTTATPATYDIYTVGTTSAGIVHARVTAIRTGGSGGTTGDAFVAELVQGVKRVGGGAALVGTVAYPFFFRDNAAANADFVVSTNTVQLRLTGVVNNNYTWRFEVFFTSTEGYITT